MRLFGRLPIVAGAAALAALVAALPLAAQSSETQLVQKAMSVFTALTASPDKEVAETMLKDVAGVAIFPGVRKWGLVVGLQRGQGILMTRSGSQGWGNPLFVTLSGGTVGWQLGVQSLDLVLFLKTRESVEQVLAGKLTVGVDAGIAAGSFGRQAGAVTDTSLKAEIYTYARSRGFFAGLALASADIIPNEGANAAFYGRRGVPAVDILAGRGVPTPPIVGELRRMLEQAVRAAI